MSKKKKNNSSIDYLIRSFSDNIAEILITIITIIAIVVIGIAENG